MPPRKKSNIFTPTKHLDCNLLWRIQKCKCFKKGIRQALQIVTTSASSQLRLLQSYQQIYGLRWRPSFQASRSSRTKMIEENIDTVRNLVEETPNSSISEVSTAMNLSTGTVWNILRRTLIKYPYKPKTVQSLTDQHKLCRGQFCNWILVRGGPGSL